MKNYLIFFIVLLISGCDSEQKFKYETKKFIDLNEVYVPYHGYGSNAHFGEIKETINVNLEYKNNMVLIKETITNSRQNVCRNPHYLNQRDCSKIGGEILPDGRVSRKKWDECYEHNRQQKNVGCESIGKPQDVVKTDIVGSCSIVNKSNWKCGEYKMIDGSLTKGSKNFSTIP